MAYQLRNGLTNFFIPTQGYFMAALGILRIPWEKWIRWLLPIPIGGGTNHLKLTFAAAKLPSSHVFEQVALTAVDENGEYF